MELHEMFPDHGASLSPDELAIAEIEREIASADSVEGVTRTWDEESVFYDMLPGQQVGKRNASAKIRAQFATQQNVRLRIIRMTVRSAGKIGYAFSTVAYSAEAQGGGPGPNLIFRRTSIYENTDGEWRLRHMHTSVPFDLETGQAQLHADG
jgi:ketosteroid isomerase-like protein